MHHYLRERCSLNLYWHFSIIMCSMSRLGLKQNIKAQYISPEFEVCIVVSTVDQSLVTFLYLQSVVE
jgi:hypothetical protein